MKATRFALLNYIVYFVGTLGFLLSATACEAMSWMYDAQVLDKGGVPCFTIQENHQKEAPKFSGIEVYDKIENVTVWNQVDINLEGSPILFSPSICFLYGTPLGSSGELTKPKTLEIGRPYDVAIGTYVSKGNGSERRSYVAQFCLTRTENGGTKVHQIIYDKGWRYEVCTSPQK